MTSALNLESIDSGSPPIAAEPVINRESKAVAPKERLAEIATTFDHFRTMYLEKADLGREYYDITEQLEFGQDVQKSGPGRPGIISKVARELALPGKSDGAKRKWLERLLKVASISPAAKSAAKQAKVARYQSDLLEIAGAGSEDEQLRKVAEIFARKHASKHRAADEKFLEAAIRYPADRKDDVLAKLATFAEAEDVELLPSN